MSIFRLSWNEYKSPVDYRPLADPPGDAILAWWCSGGSLGAEPEPYATMVALVEAENDEAAWEAIRLDWPMSEGATRSIRFCDKIYGKKLPRFPRFPIEKEWSLKRIAALGYEVSK